MPSARLIFPTIALIAVSIPISAQSVVRTLAVTEGLQNPVSARVVGLQAMVALDLNGVSFPRALETVARQAGLDITVAPSAAKVEKRVSVRMAGVSAEQAFRSILVGTPVQMTVRPGGQIVFAIASSAKTRAQGAITGKVIDATTKRPIVGAVVQLEGTNRMSQTGEDGGFRLTDVSVGTHTLTVRRLGYAKTTRTVTVGEGAAVAVDVALDVSANALDQVVVTGTVAATELKAVPNAITVVTAKQLEERGITQINQLFRGDIPGLFAPNIDSQKGLDEVEMWSRGAVKMGIGMGVRSNPIKTYVDGVEMANSQYLSQIDPKSIDRIEILTGPQASTIYGSNAINGVMQIFTKRGGAASRPQLSLTLMSGLVENNNSTARTPQHDYSAQVNGVENRLSYNFGGAWNYVGPWTPAKKMTRTSGFGGARVELPTGAGMVTADVTLRRSLTVNEQRGQTADVWRRNIETGWYVTAGQEGVLPDRQLQMNELHGQTLGFTIRHAPTSWFSHELGWGQDYSNTEQRGTAGRRSPSDTGLFISQSGADRRSMHYTTTAQIPMTSLAQLTATAGADAWQSVTSSMFNFSVATLTGSLGGSPSINRQPDHNAGGFFQAQLGLLNRLFFTYGLRAEWNPGFGENEEPNLAPRYGVAYTHDVGGVTAKVRGSFGRSTRPPLQGQESARSYVSVFGTSNSAILAGYGNFDYFLANPDLTPERQQGIEAGLELYFGPRASLVVTRYNQTVNDLIIGTNSDSSRSLVPNPFTGGNGLRPCADQRALFPTFFDENCMGPDAEGYYYKLQTQYLNLGNIRNQGWELQGSVTLGPLTGRGTYSWTKSRSMGVGPKFRSTASPVNFLDFTKGATFQYLPEHTWAAGLTYAYGKTSIGVNLTGIGQLRALEPAGFTQQTSGRIRLPQNRLRFTSCAGLAGCIFMNEGYALADLTASHQFSPSVESVLQVVNLSDSYRSDRYGIMGVMGRMTKFGFRVRLQ